MGLKSIFKYKSLKVLFSIIIPIIIIIVLLFIYRFTSNIETIDILIDMFINIITLITAIAFPLILKEFEDEKKKEEKDLIEKISKDKEREDLDNMLIAIYNLMMYCLNYTYLRNEIKSDEKKLNSLIQVFKRGSSILANIEALRLHRDILFKINSVFREIHEKDNVINMVGDPPKDRYDIYVNDRFLIRIDYDYSSKIDEYYITHNIGLHDLIENKSDLAINFQDIDSTFKNIKKACRIQFKLDLKFNKTIYIKNCENCNKLEKTAAIFSCSKTQTELANQNGTCKDFVLK